MLADPDPDPDDIDGQWPRQFVETLQGVPLSGEAMYDAALLLSGLDPTVVRCDRVKSQGRVSFGRNRAYTDGIAVYLLPTDGVESETWEVDLGHGDNARYWNHVEWDDPEAVAEKLAYVVWAVCADGQDGDALSCLDPAVALLCHGAARAGEGLQIRRGIRADGRVSFGASKGEEGVALFVPELQMARPRHGAGPAEAHIRSAYGKTPPSPHQARKTSRTISDDPEKIDGHW